MGVFEKTCRLTRLPLARAAALFHDFGKANPNFQAKLSGHRRTGYSHHAYLSAYLWLLILQQNKILQQALGISANEDILAVTTIIAKHHGDLPDLERGVFDIREAEKLETFLKGNPNLQIEGLLSALEPLRTTSVVQAQDASVAIRRITSWPFAKESNQRPLQLFLNTLYAFGSLINADKSDASGYASDQEAVASFCDTYCFKLDMFLSKLKQDTELNQLRTLMRSDAVARLRNHLGSSRRVFALTAPTGAGKTLILLSLAGEIIRAKGPYRIIYSLPFLSITEQVYSICLDIFGEEVSRIDSRAENVAFENAQAKLDDDPDAIREVLANQFGEDTFDCPFIITTFVRFFETLLSNRNATLLKLPNFGHAVFLIDEIQALPPRLYTFFVALLDAFCRMFDSYAIISTATMPDFRLPNSDPTLVDFFEGYSPPSQLLPETYFRYPQFDRYVVSRIPETVTIEELAERLSKEEQSALVILNTIDDTKKLHGLLVNEREVPNALLLNTHFTPNDRLKKLDVSRRALRRGIKTVVVSTQLVEAGVDIDFPVVYRDMSPLASIVQSAGRCNRHNLGSTKGHLVLFELENNGRRRWKLIYRGPDEKLISYLDDSISDRECRESELFEKQLGYFERIRRDLLFGYHQSKRFSLNNEIHFVERIRQAAFAEIGKFQLIDKVEFGEELRYYVPCSEQDDHFEALQNLVNELRGFPHNDYERHRLQQLRIDTLLRAMAGQVVQIRIRSKDVKPISDTDECCGLLKLDRSKYDYRCGIRLDGSNQII